MLSASLAAHLFLLFWPFAAARTGRAAAKQMHGDRPGIPRQPLPASCRSSGGEGEVTITYAGHSTYLIDTPAGVRIATDFSGVYGGNPRRASSP